MKRATSSAALVGLLGLVLGTVSCAPSLAELSTEPTTGSWLVGEMLSYSPQALSGDNLVFHEIITADRGIAAQYITLYNLRTRQNERLVTLSNDLFIDPPSIDGDRIVWASANRTQVDTYYGLDNGNWDVYLLDLKTYKVTDGINVFQITTEPRAQMGARISGDNIVWLDTRHRLETGKYSQPLDIYAYNIKSGIEKRLTSATTADGYASPVIDISGDLVVWTDIRHADPGIKSYPVNSPDYNNEIYAYDLRADQERRITTSPGNDYFPAVHDERIVWLRRSTLREADVFLYDLSTVEETRVSYSGYAAGRPDIHGSNIVWADARISKGNTSNDVVINGVGGATEMYIYDVKKQQESLLVPSRKQELVMESSQGEISLLGGDIWLTPVIEGEFVVYEKSTGTKPYLYAIRVPVH